MTDRSSRGRRWLAARAPRSTIRGRRIRSLFRAYMAKLVAGDPLHQARAMRAAELATAAEDMRAQLLAGDTSIEESLTRIENAARRAEQDLTRKPKRMTPAERRRQWLEQQEVNDGES
jgi:hypothetical protein